MAAQIFSLVKILQDGLPMHKPELISTINFVFRLHTKYASTILLATGVFLFVKQLVIDHLKCFKPLEEGKPMESPVLDEFCYATGTYAILNETYKFTETEDPREENKFYFHHYFQCVPVVLICQGLTFYFPEFLWHKFWENGRMEAFVTYKTPSDLTVPEITDSNANPEVDIAIKPATTVTITPNKSPGLCFAKTLFSPENQRYFYSYLLCELMNFLMVLITFFTSDWLLQGNFINLGSSWLDYLSVLRTFPNSKEILTDLNLNSDKKFRDKDSNFYTSRRNFEIGNPLELAFPTLFTCEWTKPAFKNVASVTYSNIKCVMGLNLTHQRIYLVFWFGLVLLFVINLVHFCYRILLIINPRARGAVMQNKGGKKGLRSKEDVELIKNVVLGIRCYDCFILQRILANVKKDKFVDICRQIEMQLERKNNFY